MPREFSSADEFVQRFFEEIDSNTVALKPGKVVQGANSFQKTLTSGDNMIINLAPEEILMGTPDLVDLTEYLGWRVSANVTTAISKGYIKLKYITGQPTGNPADFTDLSSMGPRISLSTPGPQHTPFRAIPDGAKTLISIQAVKYGGPGNHRRFSCQAGPFSHWLSWCCSSCSSWQGSSP
jgi:hypothetical protein